MKLRKKTQIDDFLKVVDSCTKDVWLTSIYGDRFNLKSIISRYVGLGALLDEHGEELELWCDAKEDEVKFFKFFDEHPDVLE